ncbi:MAG: DNA primase [Clostridiales bacterium]|nr:DNA primase [Clostridiales bacterium]
MQKKYEGNIFDHIIDNVNIVDIISSYIQVDKSGKNYKALCPFHNEKTASFIISEDKQLFHCFGCGVAGNAINFIMNYENLDYIDAVEFLAERYNIDISQFSSGSDRKNTGNLNRYYDILKDAAIFYYKNLRLHKEALQYLEKRGIQYDHIKQFGLGFSSDSWADLIKSLGSKYTTEELEKVGLIIPNKDNTSFYDRFRGRIMFPIINPKGRVIGFGGRVMDDSLPKYLNSPETEIFNKSKTLYGLNLAKNHQNSKKELIIAEGYMDVIALHLYGFTNAVATLGTALTADHARLMRRYADEIIICYDSDFAGQKAALRSLDILQGIIDKVRIVVLGENMDPDDFLKKYGVEAFQEKLDTAVSGTEFRINTLKQGYNLKDEQSKVEFLSKAVVIISQVPNAFEKNLYVEKLGEMLDVNTEMIAREVFKDHYNSRDHYGFHNKEKKNKAIPKIASDKKRYLENQLIAYFIHKYESISTEQKNMIRHFKFSDEMQEVFDYIFEYFNHHESFSRQHIIEDADLSISTKVLDVLQLHIEDIEEIDLDLVIHNIIVMTLDEEIEALKLTLKNSSTLGELQREIHQKMLMKQELTMKMRQHKFKN